MGWRKWRAQDFAPLYSALGIDVDAKDGCVYTSNSSSILAIWYLTFLCPESGVPGATNTVVEC